MSMISAQIDELRRYADRADGTFPMLASALRDAADTIQQLRDDLQRANDAVRDTEHDESRAWDRVRKAEVEADRLRELVRDYERCTMHADCSRCEYDGKLSTHCPFSPCFPNADELRELGVEVDG